MILEQASNVGPSKVFEKGDIFVKVLSSLKLVFNDLIPTSLLTAIRGWKKF